MTILTLRAAAIAALAFLVAPLAADAQKPPRVYLPVEQPTRFPFVVDLRTARALSLTLPPSVLARASQLIE